MRISDWSSDVCSSDLAALARLAGQYAFDIADAEHLPGAEYRGEEFSRRLGRVDRGGRIEAIVAIAAGRRRGLAEMPEQDRAAAPRGLDQGAQRRQPRALARLPLGLDQIGRAHV